MEVGGLAPPISVMMAAPASKKGIIRLSEPSAAPLLLLQVGALPRGGRQPAGFRGDLRGVSRGRAPVERPQPCEH